MGTENDSLSCYGMFLRTMINIIFFNYNQNRSSINCYINV